MNDTTVTSNSK